MSTDRSCGSGRQRFQAFERARAGVWARLTDRPVCAAAIALSDAARGPGLPALIIDGTPYLRPDGVYRLREATGRGAGSRPSSPTRPLGDSLRERFAQADGRRQLWANVPGRDGPTAIGTAARGT